MIWRLLAVLALAVAVSRLYPVIKILGYHVTVYNHWPGPCRIVDGINDGSEDIQVLKDGTALITSKFSHFHDPGSLTEGADGQVFAFDFNKPNNNVTEVKIVGDKFDKQMFNPHGISIYEEAGSVFVFIVNHHPKGDQVERFTFERKTKTLTHLESIRHDSFSVLNDLVAVDSTQFYVTRYNYFVHPFLRQLETYGVLKLGYVIYVDAKNNVVRRATEDGYLLGNGINMSLNKRYVYMAHIADRSVVIFKREKDNSLSLIKTIETYTMPDNIDVDADTGDLWIGCSAMAHRTVEYMKDPHNTAAPSRVLIMKMNKDGSDVEDLREVWAENELLNGVSVAVKFKDAMLIGTIHTKMMLCQIKAF